MKRRAAVVPRSIRWTRGLLECLNDFVVSKCPQLQELFAPREDNRRLLHARILKSMSQQSLVKLERNAAGNTPSECDGWQSRGTAEMSDGTPTGGSEQQLCSSWSPPATNRSARRDMQLSTTPRCGPEDVSVSWAATAVRPLALPMKWIEDVERMYIEPWFAQRLFRSSCLLCIPLLAACTLAVWDCAAVCSAVFLNSLNHWRRPRVGMRRSVDMVVVQCGLFHHLYLSLFESEDSGGSFWILCCLTGMTLYLIGRWYGNRGDGDKATLHHMGLHLVGSMGNMSLYFSIHRKRATAFADGGNSQAVSFCLLCSLMAIGLAARHRDILGPPTEEEATQVPEGTVQTVRVFKGWKMEDANF